MKRDYASGKRRQSTNVHTWGHGGIREDLGHFVRSTWEANFARVLKFEGVEYIYEPRGMKCDFLIPEWNEVVEIKPDHRALEVYLSGFYLLEEQGYRCRVVGSPEYLELKGQFQNLVEWEYTK